MSQLNVHGIGVATADPELREVGANKTPCCSVNLAFNRSWKSGDDYKKEVAFVKVQTWGVRAQKFKEIVKKGQPVYVDGYLRQEEWEKDGQKRVSFCINVNEFNLCERNGRAKSNQTPTSEPSTNQSQEPVAVASNDDDEIPF